MRRRNINIRFLAWSFLLTSIASLMLVLFSPLHLASWLIVMAAYYELAFIMRNKLSVSRKDLTIIAVVFTVIMSPLELLTLSVIGIYQMYGSPPIAIEYIFWFDQFSASESTVRHLYLILLLFSGCMSLLFSGFLFLLLIDCAFEKKAFNVLAGYIVILSLLLITAISTWLNAEGITIEEPWLFLIMKMSKLFYPITLVAFFALACAWSSRNHLIILTMILGGFLVYFVYNQVGFNPYQAFSTESIIGVAIFPLFAAIIVTLARKLLFVKYHNWVRSSTTEFKG